VTTSASDGSVGTAVAVGKTAATSAISSVAVAPICGTEVGTGTWASRHATSSGSPIRTTMTNPLRNDLAQVTILFSFYLIGSAAETGERKKTRFRGAGRLAEGQIAMKTVT